MTRETYCEECGDDTTPLRPSVYWRYPDGVAPVRGHADTDQVCAACEQGRADALEIVAWEILIGGDAGAAGGCNLWVTEAAAWEAVAKLKELGEDWADCDYDVLGVARQDAQNRELQP